MPKYEVTVKQVTTKYETQTIDAKSHEDAAALALEMLDNHEFEFNNEAAIVTEEYEGSEEAASSFPPHVCIEFRVWAFNLSRKRSKTVEQIYQWWTEYTKECDSRDQSPVQGEFEQWYAKQLSA